MEIIPEALNSFYTEEKGLVYPFLSGNWDNYYYDWDWKFLRKDKGLGLVSDIKKAQLVVCFL